MSGILANKGFLIEGYPQGPYGEVTAAKRGADYVSVKEALDFANSQASASEPFIVRAYGNFIEQPLEVGPYVILRGENCLIIPSDQDNPLCTINTFGEVWGCRFFGPANSYAVYMDAVNVTFKNGAVLNTGLHGFYVGPNTSFAVIRDTTITNQTGKAIEVDGAQLTSIIDVAMLSCGTGLYFTNGANINVASAVAVGCTTDFNQADANSMITVNACSFNEDKVTFTDVSKLRMAYNSDKEGDVRLNNYQEFGVGTPEQGFEAIFGEGDSYTRGLMAYTETDLGVFTDVSLAARSASGSTVAFPGTAVDNAIYLGSDLQTAAGDKLQFYGFKHLTQSAAVLGGGSIIIEYYNAVNGWTQTPFMETQADRRYYQYAKDIFTHTGGFQVRGPIQLQIDTDPNTQWDLSDPIASGTDRYWIRMRISSAITTSPVIEQFKLRPNSKEINADGWTEYFGSARPKGTLPIVVGAGRELSGNAQNSNVWIDDNLGAGLRNNRIANTTQYFGVGGSVPDDLDTSSIVELIVYARGEGTGAVTLNADYGFITEDDLAYSVNTVTGIKQTATSSATYTAANQVKVFKFTLDFSNVRVRKDPADGISEPDIVFLTLSGTALGTAVIFANIEVSYFKWCEGGHI